MQVIVTIGPERTVTVTLLLVVMPAVALAIACSLVVSVTRASPLALVVTIEALSVP